MGDVSIMKLLENVRTFARENIDGKMGDVADWKINEANGEKQSELQNQISELEATDVQSPQAKTAQTYDGEKYHEGKNVLKNHPELPNDLYILKKGIWYTIEGMDTGVKAQKD